MRKNDWLEERKRQSYQCHHNSMSPTWTTSKLVWGID